MLRKFGGKPSVWVLPLAAHAGVHALCTLVILFIFSGYSYVFMLGKLLPLKVYSLALLDFALHFTMDRVKASPYMWGRYKTLNGVEVEKAFKGLRSNEQRIRFASRERLRVNTYFWWSLGFDQMFHHLTDLLIVYLLFSWGFHG